MSIETLLPVNKKKRNFVGFRMDDPLFDLLEKESERREITLSDTIRRLCLQQLEKQFEQYQINKKVKDYSNNQECGEYKELPLSYEDGNSLYY